MEGTFNQSQIEERAGEALKGNMVKSKHQSVQIKSQVILEAQFSSNPDQEFFFLRKLKSKKPTCHIPLFQITLLVARLESP